MNLLQRAKHLIRIHNVAPRKRLSQNFMVDESLLRLMCTYADIRDTDVVLEIGPGLGFLTQLLAERAHKVIAVERDPRLLRVLQRELGRSNTLELVEGDILKVDVPAFNKVVSNPPFSVSSQLLFWLLNRPFNLAVLTFQEEFARRLNAATGSKQYSRLTVSTSYRAQAEILHSVPKEAFHPQPEVDAAVVRLKPRTPPFAVRDEAVFHEVVRALFTQRNKLVRNAVPSTLRSRFRAASCFDDPKFPPFANKRVRELAPEDFGVLADALAK